MPFQESKSLTADEVYAVTAYILDLNGIVGSNDVIDAQSLPKVRMPEPGRVYPVPAQSEVSFGAGRWSAWGTFRTWRNVRLESVMRIKADIRLTPFASAIALQRIGLRHRPFGRRA